MNRASLLTSISILPGLTGQFASNGEEAAGGGAAPKTGVEDLGGGAERVTLTPEEIAAASKGEPLPGTPEAEEAAKKAAGERPEGLPEGFDSWEAYGKAQVEAQAKAAEAAAKAPPEETPEAKAAREAFTKAAEPFTKAMEEKGDLTPEEVAAAAKQFNLPEEVVRQYVEGEKLLRAQGTAADTAYVAPFHSEAGGAEQFASFQEWTKAPGNLSKSELDAMNTALSTMSAEAALAVYKPAIDKWKADGGANPPKTLTRGSAGGEDTGTDKFGSMDEQMRAQQDPKYKSDPAWRKKVDAKIARSGDY